MIVWMHDWTLERHWPVGQATSDKAVMAILRLFSNDPIATSVLDFGRDRHAEVSRMLASYQDLSPSTREWILSKDK